MGPTLVLIVEGRRPRAGGMALSLTELDVLAIGRGSVRERTPDAGLSIPDPKMSSRHARLERTQAGWRLLDLGATNGCMRNGERVTDVVLADGDTLRLGDTFFAFHARELDPALVASEPGPPGVETLIGAEHMKLVRLARVAPTRLPILLRGETGTGKEVLARAIHEASGRTGPFVAVNCGAIAPQLIESQLFGHVKGAFSGAIRDEPGLFRAADGGTLFLDEIAEMPVTAQAVLLRVLQQAEVVPVGSTRTIPIDVRVLSATHQPLEERMKADLFRRDLYARIAGFVHSLPRLRERRDDLGLLIAALLARHRPEGSIRLRPELIQTFLDYDWPLNVRELEQTLSAALALSRDGALGLEDLPGPLVSAKPEVVAAGSGSASAPSGLSVEDQALRQELIALLRANGGNVSATARAMNKARQQIQRWIRRLEIQRAEYER